MFTTCIHCAANLGRNEALEEFPVGQRLAFDPAKGRLWVVCRACARWNLSPLDERWEAIEAAERRYRDSRLRVSTDHIGLARLREGLDLIRIGDPQRPEMAAWRYGDQFGRRRKRQLLLTGAVVGSAAALVGGVMWIGVGAASFAGVYGNGGLWDMMIHGSPETVIGHISLPDGRVVAVKRKHARMSALENVGGDDVRFRLESEKGTHVLTGPAAMRAAAKILPTVNRFGGSSKQVQEAVGVLEAAGNAGAALRTLQRQYGWKPGEPYWGARPAAKTGWLGGHSSSKPAKRDHLKKLPGTLHTLNATTRLAIEMALHEESERRAMDGELHELERAWRDAEEIAKISDDMFVPESIEARREQLRADHGARSKAEE